MITISAYNYNKIDMKASACGCNKINMTEN